MTPSTLTSQLGAQRRTVTVLALATILGGLGVGASLSAGALLIADITGNPALSGLGSTMNAVGAAVAGMPLARLAAKRGRRIALAAGNLTAVCGAVLVIVAAATHIVPLLFAGLAVLGVAVAVQLQSRFAATDLALPERRGRDLSFVVWSITIGAVTGPNLIGPGEHLGAALGLPGLAGIFIFTIAAQFAAACVVWIGLRPDPLLESRRLATAVEQAKGSSAVTETHTNLLSSPMLQYLAIAVIALAHAVMVGLMAMTPLHLTHHGGSIELVGFTISIHIAGMYALSPVFGYLTGRFGAIPVIFAGFVVLGLAAIGTFSGGESVAIIQTSLVLLGLGWSMVTVAGATLLTNLTPLSQRPRRQGQSDTAMNAAGALFGAASGVIFAVGGFPTLSVIAGVLILLGVVAAARLAVATRG